MNATLLHSIGNSMASIPILATEAGSLFAIIFGVISSSEVDLTAGLVVAISGLVTAIGGIIVGGGVPILKMYYENKKDRLDREDKSRLLREDLDKVSLRIAGMDSKSESSILELIVATSPTGAVIVRRDGKITLANIQAELMFGYQRFEMVGMPLSAIVPPHLRAVHAVHLDQYFDKPSLRRMGQGLKLRGYHSSGKEFPIEVGLHPIKAPGETVVFAVIVEVPERNVVELASIGVFPTIKPNVEATSG